jgi:hypothetical protein
MSRGKTEVLTVRVSVTKYIGNGADVALLQSLQWQMMENGIRKSFMSTPGDW